MKAHRVALAGWTPWLLGMAVLALVAGCSKPAPPPPPVVAAPPPPPPISVESIPSLVVHAGTSGTSRFKIDRAGRVGDVSITVAQPPEGLTVVADKVPAESTSGSIVVKAAESLGEADTETTFSITATLEEATAEQTVTVKVPKFEGPSLTAEEEPTVQPGRKATLRMRVDRKGAPPRPIELAAEAAAAPDQPAESEPGAATKREISFAATTVPADADVVSLDLDVAPGVKDGPRTIEVFARTMGRQFPLTFKVDVRGKPYALKLPLALAVAPGAKKTFDLQVERTKYDGPISIAVDNLPDGVAVDAPEIPAGADKAEVTVTASADAAARVRSAILRTTGGPFAASRPLVVRVRPEGSDAWLPDAVKVGRDGKPLKKNVWIGGRLSPEGKQALMDFFGGTPESEAAIVRGLAWLAKTQKEDGSWSLFKDGDPTGEDSKDSATAATAFGILPFLGEGIIPSRAPAATPELENYKAVVEKGLIYLASKQVQDKGRNEGYFGESMYAHCLATIAFCEAFALSGEERVRFHARQGVKYLLAAQDAEGGGWRYSPKQPGDMSVTGWVIVALRTAQLTGISVTSQQLRKARKFVDSCGVGPADVPRSQYCYVTEKPATPPMTAAGLLSQLYLGWERDEPELAAGRTQLMNNLPPETASTVGRMYYFYYATQVLHHLEGEEFDAWNHLMRDHLVGLQIKDGDLAGSWDPQGVDYGVRAGRMYTTSLALLTLQVYYRHLPIYRIPSTTAQAPAAEGEADVERPGAPRGT